MIKKAYIFLGILFLSFCNYGFAKDDEKILEGLIYIFGRDRYEKLDNRAKAFFSNKGLIQINREAKILLDKFDPHYVARPNFESLYGSNEEWNSMTEGLLKLYPDFHEKAELKVQRLIIFDIIQEDSLIYLDKDIKIWPDMLSHFPRIFEIVEYKFQPAALRYLLQNQNQDGSWGESNKLHCSSIAILTYLINGETPYSKKYGASINKAVSFLKSQNKNIDDENIQLYFWALCEFYTVTENKDILGAVESVFPAFKESISWDYQKEPYTFFIQNQTAHAYQETPFKNDFGETFVSKIRTMYDEDSISLNTVKRQWQKSYKTSSEFTKKLADQAENTKFGPINDIMIGRYLFLEPDSNIRNVFRRKILNYLDGTDKYIFNNKFTAKEKKLLQEVYPFFVLQFSFPMSYTGPSKSNSKNQSEGLDLVK